MEENRYFGYVVPFDMPSEGLNKGDILRKKTVGGDIDMFENIAILNSSYCLPPEWVESWEIYYYNFKEYIPKIGDKIKILKDIEIHAKKGDVLTIIDIMKEDLGANYSGYWVSCGAVGFRIAKNAYCIDVHFELIKSNETKVLDLINKQIDKTKECFNSSLSNRNWQQASFYNERINTYNDLLTKIKNL